MVILRWLCLFLIAHPLCAVEQTAPIPIEFTGNDRINNRQLMTAAAYEFERFQLHQHEADLFDASYSILQYMRDKGHYFARVDYAYVPNKKQPQKVLFTITEKLPVTIQDINITGAEAWKEWEEDDISLTIAFSY